MSIRAFLWLLSIASLFAAAFLNVSFWEPFASATTINELKKPLVAVIVDSGIYDGIEYSLQQYKDDVEKSGFLMQIAQTNEMANRTKEAVREYLQRLLNQNLVGALLVGDIPEAWYEVGLNRFPTDMYYMDLNGTWMDTDGNGIYDKHNETLSPEIWVGRLETSTVSGDAVSLVNNYFEKNHRYRNSLIHIPWWRALLYMDDQGVLRKHDALTPLRYIATDITAVTEGYTTNATDYKQRLRDETGYNWLYLMCHGTAINHTFIVPSKESFKLYEWDGTVHSSDYRTIDPSIFFYHFFVCSGGRYTEQDYLAGSSVFATTSGLLAIASTGDAYTYPFNDFYKALSMGNTVGDAFLVWLKRAVQESLNPEVSGLKEADYEIMLNDAVMIGDPSLRLYVENHDVAITNLLVFSKNVSGVESLTVSVAAENVGDFTETFDVIVSFDSEILYQNELTLAAKESEAITFSPSDSSRYMWGNFSRHTVDAQASVLLGEFNTQNNFYRAYYYGNIIQRSLPREFPIVFFFAIGICIFGIVELKLFRELMSERPLYRLRKGVKKIYAYLDRVLSK